MTAKSPVPACKSSEKADACADRDRPAIFFLFPGHARCDRCQHENAFQTLTEDQHPDIKDGCRTRGMSDAGSGLAEDVKIRQTRATSNRAVASASQAQQ
jgi:hypothetical protein